MKKILIYTLLLLLLSCSEEHESSDFTLEVRNYYEETFYTYGNEQAVYLWSTKSWADGKIGKVEYKVDEEILEKYNSDNGTDYQLLPSNCYSVEQSVFSIDDETRTAKFKVMCSPEKMIEAGSAYNDVKYVLPFRIYVDDKAVEDRYGTVLVGFKVLQPLFSVTPNVQSFINEAAIEDFGLSLPYKINFPNNTWINLSVSADASLVEAYNSKNGTSYNAFPSDAISWDEESAILQKGEEEGTINVSADLTKMVEGKDYMLALKLSNVSSGIVDPVENVRYYIFNYADRIPQSLFKAVAGSTREGSANNLVDDQVTTGSYWHWNWGSPLNPNASITISLKDQEQTANIRALEFYTRQGNTWGNRGAKAADIFSSMDGENWEKIGVMNFGYSSNTTPIQTAQFFVPSGSVAAKYFKVQVTDKYDDGIAFSEIYTLGTVE